MEEQNVSIPLSVLQRAETLEDIKEWLRESSEQFEELEVYIPTEEEILAARRKMDANVKALKKETEAFLRTEDELRKKYEGKCVAISGGEVIGVADDEKELVTKLNDKIGFQPIYISRVGDEIRVRSEAEEEKRLLAARKKEEEDLAGAIKDREAYLRMENELRKKYLGRYVAIADGKLIAVGDDEIGLIYAIYCKFGQLPMYVHKVGEPERIIEIG